MFAKLLKHEWKSSSRILGVLSLAALGVGVLGAVVMRIITTLETRPDATGILSAILGVGLFFLFIALFAYVAAVEIILLYRFYKNKFTDEGYLTFTLPVNSHQIFLSSLLNILAWSAIAAVVMFTSMGTILLLGVDWRGMGSPEDFRMIFESYQMMFEFQGGTEIIPLAILTAIASTISGVIIPMTCLTIGAVVAKKHKILAAFGIGYAVSIVTGMVSGVMSAVAMLSVQDFNMAPTYLAEFLTQLALGLGGYFLSTYLMSKKLNLP